MSIVLLEAGALIVLAKYIFKKKNSKVWYFRRRIPEDVLGHYPSKQAKVKLQGWPIRRLRNKMHYGIASERVKLPKVLISSTLHSLYCPSLASNQTNPKRMPTAFSFVPRIT
ncbi:DUF6538 domain-containing protein [Sulfitobacter geojensis]|uniref:DUF6538 domain-containing protein n=1 Tax=Sulfitobacter geojensis TaxID=1342299 RepID=UPI003B8A5F36